MYTCEICGNSFRTLTNLNKHQNNAKYCMNLRNSNDKTVCEKCCNTFNNSVFDKHFLECKGKCIEKDKEILELKSKYEQEILHLKSEIEKLKVELQTTKEYANKFIDITTASATKPTTTTNTVNNNKIVLKNCVTDERIKKAIPSLTIEDLKEGPIGISNWAHKNFLYDSAVCTDVSRKKIVWKDDNDTIIKDYRGFKLCKKIFKAIHKDNYKLITKYIKKTTDYLENECKDPVERERMYNMIFKLYSIKSECSEASQGIINDFVNKFVKQLTFVLDNNSPLMDEIDSSDESQSDSESSESDIEVESDSDESQKIVFKKGPKMFTNPKN